MGEVLIYDRIREDLRIFCANKTIDEVYNKEFLEIVEAVKNDVNKQIKNLGKDGVEIMNLVIPKPDIPQDIEKNYKQVKVQWTQQLVAEQQQKTEEIKKETERINAVADAQRQKDVLEIKIQEQIIEMEGKKNISEINNEMAKERENNLADIAKYAKTRKLLVTRNSILLSMSSYKWLSLLLTIPSFTFLEGKVLLVVCLPRF